MTNPFETPVSRGRFLDYPRYDKMGDEWKAERRQEEAKQIFANFTTADQGRSRILICTMSDFNTDAHANYLCLALNNIEDCMEALREILPNYEMFIRTGDGPALPIHRRKAARARALLERIDAENEG